MKKRPLIYLTISGVVLVLSIVFKLLKVSNYIKGLGNTLVFLSTSITIILTIVVLILKDKVNEKSRQSFDLLWFTLTIISIISFINVFFYSTVNVYQSSMLPTYKEGDLLLVTQFNYKPQRGDVVIVHTKTEELYIKRLMAIEGDLITFLEDDYGIYILINNETVLSPKNDKYYISSTNMEVLKINLNSGKIPPSKCFVLGDNAPNSKDSRDESIGLIDTKDILGKVTKTIKGGK